jgi:hypothetical protein
LGSLSLGFSEIILQIANIILKNSPMMEACVQCH